MADFGKLNFAVAFNPQTAFPLDARYYFSTLEEAQTAAASAVEVGSSDGTYFFGENIAVVTADEATLYVIQPDGTLKAAGSEVLGDGESIEIVDGAVSIVGFSVATAGQQPRVNAAGNGIEWVTPDTTTVSGLSETVAGHTSDIANLQENKADKATTLEGYGITDAMTATAIAEAIAAAVAASGHASYEVVDAVPEAASAVENVLYLVRNSDTGYLDIYALISGSMEKLDDTSVDLSNYLTQTQIETLLAGKVDVVDGMGLSSNDYTTAEKEKLAGIEDGAEANYISSVSEEFTVTDGLLAVAAIPLTSVTGLETALAGKVDAVDGMGLSSNDFTTVEKTKLGNIADGAQVNVLEDVQINGTSLEITAKAVNIPLASTTEPGVMSADDKTKLDSVDLTVISGLQTSVTSLEASVATAMESVAWGDI